MRKCAIHFEGFEKKRVKHEERIEANICIGMIVTGMGLSLLMKCAWMRRLISFLLLE